MTKSSHYQTIIFSGLVICVLATSLLFFSRVVNYLFFHILILHCTVVLVCKIKNNDDLLYFKFTRTLVFTICPTVMLNIGDSSIRCLEKNTDVHQQIQTLIVKTDHLALKLCSIR